MAFFEGLDEDKRYQNTIPERQNRITEGIEDTKYDLFGKQHGIWIGKNLVGLIFSALVIFLFLHMIVWQRIAVFLKMQDKIYVADSLSALLSIPGIIFFAVVFLASSRALFVFRRGTKTDHTIDKNGRPVANKDIYGDTRDMSEEEEALIFNKATDPTKIPGYEDILGYREGKHGEQILYAFKPKPNESNKNTILFGEPGSGKTVKYAIANIIQMAMRGVSIITTDSKGDLYKATAYIMEKFFGYEVKILNVKPVELRNSDGCDFLKIMKKGKNTDAKAQTIASTVIHNTEGSEFLDYWSKNELNLFKALILYITHNDEMIAQHKDNLAGLYDYVTTKSLAEITEDFALLSKTDPARQAFNIFANCDPKVQGQILNGFQTRIELMSNPDLKGLVASDEIDLTLPMKKRCIYYVVIPDTESTYNFIANLFFAELFIELCEYSDGLNETDKKAQIPVTFLLDEFYSTGTIPEFEKKISTVRSRKIALTLILQDLGQLERMYPDKGHTTILNAIPTKMLLGTNDLETAEYFANLMGTQTIKVEGERFIEERGDAIHVHPVQMKNEGYGKRLYMNPEQILRKPEDEILLICKGSMPTRVKKWVSYNHPLIKQNCYNPDGSYKERLTTQHVPQWVTEQENEEAEKKKKTEELKAKLGIGSGEEPKPKDKDHKEENGNKPEQKKETNNTPQPENNNNPENNDEKKIKKKEENEIGFDHEDDDDFLFGAFQ